MSGETIELKNRNDDFVTLDKEVATKLFVRLQKVDKVINAAEQGEDVEDKEDDEEGVIEVPRAGPGARPPMSAAPPLGMPGRTPEPTGPLQLDNLDCSKEVLEALCAYSKLPAADRTTSIPKPINAPLVHIVKPHEMEMLEAAQKGKYITPLTELAIYLQFEELSNLCAAYIYQSIEKIAKDAKDIMAGAEEIRQWMNIPNEWTEEEMGHLRKEMELAKQLDPNAY